MDENYAASNKSRRPRTGTSLRESPHIEVASSSDWISNSFDTFHPYLTSHNLHSPQSSPSGSPSFSPLNASHNRISTPTVSNPS